VKLMYFDEPKGELTARGGAAGYALSANGLALLVFGILPQPLMAMCLSAIQGL
jgi:NADH-quinone oxidoreductase subunit N